MISSATTAPELNIFCDWLDTTYAPDSPVIDDTQSWVQVNGGECIHRDEKCATFRVGGTEGGILKFDTAKRYSRISASGQVLAYFRSLGIFLDYLSELSSEPHNVSRLDTALYLPLDGADVIDSLRKRFSVQGGSCSLGRKSLPVTYVLGVRSDGRETGTFYAGHRTQARQTGRVYDKAFEALQKRGEHLPPTTRYEMTSRGEKGRAGPSLRDAAEPSRLFWSVASPTLLKAPAGTPEWVSGWDGGWSYDKPETLLPAEALARSIDHSAALDSMLVTADKIGPEGRVYFMRLLERKILGANTLDS